tara:strand:+ start:363 stop:767 length:405 start_codon:yes stop_codon:yes gene_type:complete
MEIIMSKTLTKKEICLKYSIKAPKLEYHIKKVATKRSPMPFPKGKMVKGVRHFKEKDVEKYADANKTFSKPSHKELGMAEAVDFTTTHDAQFENKMWETVNHEPWYVRHKLLVRAVVTAIVAGAAAAIVSSFVS